MNRDRERRQPFARIATAATVALLATATASARAEPSAGCTASSSPTMLTVGAGPAQTRQVDLAAGERLDFTATADQGAAVTIALVSGAGAPQTLLAGETPAAATFSAAEPGTYTFRLEASAPAAVSLRCLASTAEVDLQRAFLTRRSEFLMMDRPSRTRIDAKPQAPAATATGPVPGAINTDEDGRPTRMAFSMSLSELAAVGNPDARYIQPGILDFWLEGRYEAYATALPDGAAGDGRLGVVYLGTKYMLHPDIMVGALAQFDKAGEAGASEAPSLQATGWMAGPYISARLGAGFVLDGRAAWGRADESLGADLHHSGARQLVQARLSGNRQIEGWTFSPSLAVRYFEEATAATPVLSPELAGGPGVGRVDLLPEISRRYQMSTDTFVEPRFAVGGFWALDDLARMPSAHGAMTDVRLKAEAGVSLGVKEGASLSAVGGVEQGAEAAENVWSGQLQLKVPLNK